MQRARVYSVPGLTERERLPLHATLQRALEEVSTAYAVPVTEAIHVVNISALAAEISEQHAAILRDRRFRIGAAQKALNLFLKYLWCLDAIPTPPHCPFDQRIIAVLPTKVRCNWTELDEVSGYQRLVDAARECAGTVPLAEWELDTYNTLSARIGGSLAETSGERPTV